MKVLLVAALLGMSAMVPAGFKEAPRLDAGASYIAGKPVKVWCSTSQAAYAPAAAAATGKADTAGFVQQIGGTDEFFIAKVCATVNAYLNRRNVSPDDLAVSFFVLAHEATHLSGQPDESVADCNALHKMPAMIRQFFKPRPGYTVHDLMPYAWVAHRRQAAAYQRLC